MEKEKNSLIKNSIYNVLYKILNMLFPLIMSAYASHIILAKGIGKVASAQNIVQYFVLIAALGIPQYGIREIAKSREDKVKENKIFIELFTLNLISTIFCSVIYYVVAYYFGWFDEKNLYLIVGWTIILNAFNVDWFYQGEEDYKYIAIRSFIVKLFSLAALFILVNDENDYANYALINVLALAGNYVFNVIHLKKKNIKIFFKGINLRDHLQPIFILLCTTLSIELYTLLDTTMLTAFCTDENVGYYTMALKIPRMIIIAVTGLSGVLLPRLSRYYEEGRINEINNIINKTFHVLLFIFLPCGIGLYTIAPNAVIVLFGESFIPGIITLRIASLLIYALGFSNLFGTQILLTFGYEKKLLICTITGAIINICLNLTLIPVFQQNGAAIASVISELIVTCMALYFSRKFIKIKMNKIILFGSVIGSFTMSVCCLLIIKKYSYGIKSLILSLTIGIITYLLINFIFKNPIIDIIKKLRN